MEMGELERISEFGEIFGGNDVFREEMDVGGARRRETRS